MTMITTWNLWEHVAGLTLFALPAIILQIWIISQNAIRSDPSREKKLNTRWLASKELARFANLLQLLYSKKFNTLTPQKNEGKGWKVLYPIIPEIQRMWQKSGITFTITYWAEVLRLVVQYLDCRSKPVYNKKTWVKIHKGKLGVTTFAGLPSILPIRVKELLRIFKGELLTCSLTRGHLIQLKLILSFLSFFRACSPKWSRSQFSSVTGKFTGISRELSYLECGRALKSLGITTLLVGKPSIFWPSAKVGPNLPVSVLGIGLDLIGWMSRPHKYLVYLKICWRLNYYVLILQFVFFSLLMFPIWLLCYFIGLTPLLGHIAILKEARGKRRLIGITDFWTQILFRPLHDAIYKALNKLDEDGTRDQSGPILNLLSKLKVQDLRKVTKDKIVQSLDLSAATDRLPVDLQVQILRMLGYPGDLWKSVLEREWDIPNGKPIKYEVGQPMGAYSSFAMLALTNHVLVHIAKRRAKSPIVNYAILGDDVVIAGRKISNHYKELLTYLGVEVNPIKGFDGGILEFAKQLWTINGINISPLGAKNLMLAIRNPAFLPSILFELWTKRFPMCYRVLPRKEIRDRKKRRVRGTEVPFLTANSLLRLVSALWYKPGKMLGTLGWVKPLLHLASYIGPRSGLWYVGPEVRSYLRGWDYDLYQHLWWDIILKLLDPEKLKEISPFDPSSPPNTLVRPGVHPDYKVKIFTKLKFERERLIGTYRVIWTSWKDGYKHIRNIYSWPYTLVPRIRNWFWFEEDKYFFKHKYVPFIFSISIVCSPAIPIVALDIIRQCLKVVLQAWKLTVVRYYRALIFFNRYGLHYLNCLWVILSISLTHDLHFTFYVFVIGLVLHWLVTSKLMILFINKRVFFTKHYGCQGRNIVTDITSKVLNPYDGVENLLDRVKLEYKSSEEVPSYKETIRLVRYEPLVRRYFKEVETLKKKSENASIYEKKWTIEYPLDKNRLWDESMNSKSFGNLSIKVMEKTPYNKKKSKVTSDGENSIVTVKKDKEFKGKSTRPLGSTKGSKTLKNVTITKK